ncbi:hypothetical protein [Streptomyces malaysiensis]|uniref:30S ribosomal protein S2 n=1 Tax=Streptomyces malaysiensis TaxID=92644 RepID=A0A7X6B0M4_STRMQ|nr:hypothetical protein [Streptomyces malaysiensis]NIY68407.1 30S ribosomal protein S2 [Streptomyces malaysiensis]
MSRKPGNDDPDAVAELAELPERIDARRSRLSALLADIPASAVGRRRGTDAHAGTGTSSFIEDWEYSDHHRPPREETPEESPAEAAEGTGEEPTNEE